MAGEEDISRRRAVALRYDANQDDAPRIVAKGRGLLAERIVEVAREHDIYVHEDPNLVSILAGLDVNAHVPESLYRAVAEVLAFVYRLDGRLGEQRARQG